MTVSLKFPKRPKVTNVFYKLFHLFFFAYLSYNSPTKDLFILGLTSFNYIFIGVVCKASSSSHHPQKAKQSDHPLKGKKKATTLRRQTKSDHPQKLLKPPTTLKRQNVHSILEMRLQKMTCHLFVPVKRLRQLR